MRLSFIQLFLTVVLILCSFTYIRAEATDQEITQIHEYADLQITEMTLKNGMKVVLKHTDDESEICVRLAALGGYASLSSEDRASGELAAPTVLESGLGGLDADQLSAFLYDQSIDFNLKIEPYTRCIDASLPEESLEAFFDLVNKTFVSPNFYPEAFLAVLAEKRNELAHKTQESSNDDILSLVSVQEKHVLRSLKRNDLEKANFNKSKQFFLATFSNPADFICVIVGNIDVQKTKQLAIGYLSTISSRNINQNFILPRYNKTPKEIAMKTQNLPYSNESLVRLALPLQIKLDCKKLEQLELVCQILETRLRNIVKSQTYDAKGVDIWYELPLYPSLEHPWMTIQFHVVNNHIRSTIDLVFDELRRICEIGPSLDEIKLAMNIKLQSLKLWEHDNDYWLVLMSNHYLWGWDPQKIAEKFKNPITVDPQEIHSIIRQALLMNDYSFSIKR